jgi:hypothetical protein
MGKREGCSMEGDNGILAKEVVDTKNGRFKMRISFIS